MTPPAATKEQIGVLMAALVHACLDSKLQGVDCVFALGLAAKALTGINRDTPLSALEQENFMDTLTAGARQNVIPIFSELAKEDGVRYAGHFSADGTQH